MKTDPELIELPCPPAEPKPVKRRRRTGKVACLPHEIREQINRMLQNGVPYRRIIEKLHEPGVTPLPHEISENNLSDWKDGGYQDWLKDQFWQDDMRARLQTFSGLLTKGGDAIQLPEGGLQLAVIGLCELLRDVSEASADPKADPDKVVRLANSLARVSRSIVQLQQYRDACTRARAALQELKDADRKLSENETRAIVRHVDGILGLRSMDDVENPSPESSADLQSAVSQNCILQPSPLNQLTPNDESTKQNGNAN
jgi:hypothetical protein